jgi:hypothetical protein
LGVISQGASYQDQDALEKGKVVSLPGKKVYVGPEFSINVPPGWHVQDYFFSGRAWGLPLLYLGSANSYMFIARINLGHQVTTQERSKWEFRMMRSHYKHYPRKNVQYGHLFSASGLIGFVSTRVGKSGWSLTEGMFIDGKRMYDFSFGLNESSKTFLDILATFQVGNYYRL